MIANRYHRLALAFVAAALVLAGCAGDDGDEAPGANPNATIETGDRFEVERWRGEGDNAHTAQGRVLLNGRPVANVGLRVNAYRLRIDDDGRFSYRVANSLARRYPISVDDVAAATIEGDELSSAERAALREAQGAITVAYRLSEIEVEPRPNATLVIRGRLTARDGTPPAPAALFSYRLSGRVVDADGRPRANAVVLTQTLDREGSTFSTPTDARGRYRSFYWPRGDDPVTLSVAEGQESWELSTPLTLPRFRSARLDVRLGDQGSIAPPTVTAEPGAFYDGVLVGPLLDGKPLVPLAGTWPGEDGRFQLVLSSSAGNGTLSLYEAPGYYFSRTAAEPGRTVQRSLWPTQLRREAPRGLGARDLAPERWNSGSAPSPHMGHSSHMPHSSPMPHSSHGGG